MTSNLRWCIFRASNLLNPNLVRVKKSQCQFHTFAALLRHNTRRSLPSMCFSSKRYQHSSLDASRSSIYQKIRILTKHYGPISLILYVSMSLTTFTCIFIALLNGVDVDKLFKYVYSAVSGFDAETETEEEQETVQKLKHDSNAPFLHTMNMSRLASTFVVAFTLNKFLTPFKAMLTAFLTPPLSRWWKGRFRP